MTTIAFNSTVLINLHWVELKTLISAKNIQLQYVDLGDVYQLFALDGPIAYTCELTKAAVSFSSVFDENYTQEQNDVDVEDFETHFRSAANKSLEPRTGDGRIMSATGKQDGSRTNFFSHNWCDKTTWYEQSVKVTLETATDSGDHLTYTLAHSSLIDTYHGKLTGEDFLKDASNSSYRVAVKVNSVAKTEQDPHFGTGGDYTVDYAAGSVTFLAAQDPSDVVTVTYHYANGSRFTIKPATGKKLVIDLAEVQFSTDIDLKDTIRYAAYGYVDVFAPQYLQAKGGPYPSGTLIPLGNPFVYKTMQDYLNDSIKSYPKYDPIGGEGWRGMSVSSTVFEWDYVRSLVLSSAAGMEIRMSLDHDTPFEGAFATATLYAGSVTE